MKKILFCFAFTLCVALSIKADDVIVKRNGDVVQCRVLEVTKTEVRYKKASNPDGPTYTMETSEILAINYENGDKDTFDSKPADAPKQDAPHQDASKQGVADAEANAVAVAKFNSTLPTPCDKTGKAKAAIAIFGITEGSVIEDANIALDVKNDRPWDDAVVQIKNKTTKTLYIDLGNSFFSRDGQLESYYRAEATTTSQSSSVGVGVGIGLIGIGGSSTSGTSTTTYSQRVVMVPPMSTISLEAKQIFFPAYTDKNHEDEYIKARDAFYAKHQNEGWRRHPMRGSATLNLADDNIPMKGEVVEVGEAAMSFRFGIHLSYSLTEDCATLYSLSSQYFIKSILGIHSKTMDGQAVYDQKALNKDYPDNANVFANFILLSTKKSQPTFKVR